MFALSRWSEDIFLTAERSEVLLKINQRDQKAILDLLHSDYSAFLSKIDRKWESNAFMIQGGKN